MPGPSDGHSWTWVGNCANPTQIALNCGFGGITGKSANVQLCVFDFACSNLRFEYAVLAGAAFSFARSRLEDRGADKS